MKKNVLIAGGCGLIGREIVKALIKEDYNVSIGDIKNKKKFKLGFTTSRK